MVAHGSVSTCFMPSEIRLVALLTSSTMTSTVSPTLTSFEGCRTRRVQDISETCTSPSTPGSSSTKAP